MKMGLFLSEPSEPASKPLTVDVAKAQEAAEIDDLPEVLSPRDILASPAYKELPQRQAKKFSPNVSGKKAAVPNVVHAQYNSPMGLYSAENIASQYAVQTAGIQKEMESVNVCKTPVGTTMSGTYQVLDK